MAITTQDIHAAADRLAAEGQQPTLAAVRSSLGGGSFYDDFGGNEGLEGGPAVSYRADPRGRACCRG